MSSSGTARKKLARLSGMDWNELLIRLQQEFSKRQDALVWRVGAGSVARELRGPARHRKARHDPALQFPLTAAAISSPRFFFAEQDVLPIVELLRERLPRQAQAIVEEAERICRHQFNLLGYQNLDYGPVIDWHRDAVNNKRAPRKPWYKVQFLDFEITGDHKVIWELNRHQHWLTLAKAYRLTGDARFVRELLEEWRHWKAENPYPVGINWASSLEIAFRSLAWLWTDRLLASCPAVPQTFQGELLRALALNARHMERYLSTYWSPNTHLLGEAVGLFCIGLLYPELRSAARWRELGWRIVLEQAERQVEADGLHFEQSVYYHVYALDMFLHARILAAVNRIPVPEPFDRKIRQMLEILCGIGQSGLPPRFGDEDGGRLFDPRRNRARHILDPLSVGAALFDRADYKAASGGLTEETLWLLGLQGARRFDALAPEAQREASRAFPASGLYVMASSRAASADGPGHGFPAEAATDRREQLVIRAGLPQTGSSGHAHADSLSIHLSARGEEWLTDPGAFLYTSKGSDRDFFRSTAAHNTLRVDGTSQAEPAGLFAWHGLPGATVSHWVAGECFDLFAGSHGGYQRLLPPVTHCRWVVHVKAGLWLVRDVAEGEGEHELDIFWHFAPHLVPSYADPGVLLRPNSGPRGAYRALLILPVHNHGWIEHIERGRVSPAYGAEEAAPVVRFSLRAALPRELTVVLDPITGISDEKGCLTALGGDGQAAARGFRYERADTRHFFLFGNENGRWHIQDWGSDAYFVYCRIGPTPTEGLRPAGGPERETASIALCGGSYLEIGGQKSVSFPRRAERWELNLSPAGVKPSGSDLPALSGFQLDALKEALSRLV